MTALLFLVLLAAVSLISLGIALGRSEGPRYRRNGGDGHPPHPGADSDLP